MGLFKRTLFKGVEENKFHILTITDIFSRKTKLKLVYQIDSKITIKAFKEWIEENGAPKRLTSDNSKSYISSATKRFFDLWRVRNTLTSRYNPQSNGISERLNLSVVSVLRAMKGFDISEVLKCAEKNLNETFHRILGCSLETLLSNKSSLDPLERKIDIDTKQ